MKMNSRVRSMWMLTVCYVLAIACGIGSYFMLPLSIGFLWRTLICDVIATVVVFAFSVVCDNSSMYDPYWSVIPPLLYAAWLWFFRDMFTLYGLLFFIVMLFWSVRLTVNCVTHWGGLADEDWRYVSFRLKFGSGYWLVSFFAIHFFPTVIVFACSIPAWYLLAGPLSRPVFAIVGLCVILLGTVLELVADIQMTSFQKHRTSVGQSCAVGLWGCSRHPNYLGEILVWWGVFTASLANIQTPWWFIIFPVAMTALFLGYSIPAMEKRQLSHRPSYAKVKAQVPILLPVPGKYFKEN